MNNTQRPARNPEIAPNPSKSPNLVPTPSPFPVGIFNRFGGDDDSSKESGISESVHVNPFLL